MKVIEALWFTGFKGTVGIVVVEEDVTGDRKAYIGAAEGKDEKVDTDSITSWGLRFSLETALRIAYLLGSPAKRAKAEARMRKELDEDPRT